MVFLFKGHYSNCLLVSRKLPEGSRVWGLSFRERGRGASNELNIGFLEVRYDFKLKRLFFTGFVWAF